ncbi:MAG: bicupin, oxalate decarboxylase family [Edaphobacter sp.]|nr:bicupin, oxalate decarboxylase family [Edaphobacter sp.]
MLTVTKGDLWFFPAGYPHSIQGLGPGDGCQFLLVFDEDMFSEDNTFLISSWVAHTPPEILTKNSNFDRNAIAKLPKDELYIFPATLLHGFPREIKRIPDRADVSMIGWRWHIRIRILIKKRFIVLPWIARGMVTFSLTKLSVIQETVFGTCITTPHFDVGLLLVWERYKMSECEAFG